MRQALSHSRIELFETCPRKYRAITIDKMPWKKGIPLYAGGFLHDLADGYIKAIGEEGRQTDLEGGMKLFADRWLARHEHEEFKNIPEQEANQLLEAWTGFLENHVFDFETVVGSEMEVALTETWEPTDWFAKDVFFRAKMDLVTLPDDKPTITDFKSSYAVPGKDEAENSPQLRRYVMALLSTPGKLGAAEEYRVVLDFIRPNVQREVILPRGVGMEERERTMAISDAMEKMIAKNSKDAWPARPGNECGDCPLFANGCPAQNLAEPERGIQDPESAETQFARLIMLNEEAKRIRGALESYTANAGTVRGGGVEFGPKVTEDYEWDVLTLREWANRNGISIEDIVRTRSRTDLEKLAKKSADKSKAMAELLGIATIKRGTEYRIRKAAIE
jgi:hypothetical protein